MNGSGCSRDDIHIDQIRQNIVRMKAEISEKDILIEKQRKQIGELPALNERLNSGNRSENVRALKNGLMRKSGLLKSAQEKTKAAEAVSVECLCKLQQVEMGIPHCVKCGIPIYWSFL